MAVHGRWCEYDPKLPIRPWLIAFAARLAANHRRRPDQRQARSGNIDPMTDALAHDGPLPDAQLAAAQDRALVLAALETLDNERRVVFVAAEIEELGMPEIAAALGILLNTGYTRLRLARADSLAAAVARGSAPGGCRERRPPGRPLRAPRERASAGRTAPRRGGAHPRRRRSPYPRGGGPQRVRAVGRASSCEEAPSARPPRRPCRRSDRGAPGDTGAPEPARARGGAGRRASSQRSHTAAKEVTDGGARRPPPRRVLTRRPPRPMAERGRRAHMALPGGQRRAPAAPDAERALIERCSSALVRGDASGVRWSRRESTRGAFPAACSSRNARH